MTPSVLYHPYQEIQPDKGSAMIRTACSFSHSFSHSIRTSSQHMNHNRHAWRSNTNSFHRQFGEQDNIAMHITPVIQTIIRKSSSIGTLHIDQPWGFTSISCVFVDNSSESFLVALTARAAYAYTSDTNVHAHWKPAHTLLALRCRQREMSDDLS